MHYCKGCESMVYAIFVTPSSERLCDYCSDKEIRKPKRIMRPRDYNNTKLAIKRSHGTIKKWAQKQGFNPGTVQIVLNSKVACFEQYSNMHHQVFDALKAEGLQWELESDNYLPRKESSWTENQH